jgi:hypothetical protein
VTFNQSFIKEDVISTIRGGINMKKYTEQELIEMGDKRVELYMCLYMILKNNDNLTATETKTILQNLQLIERIDGVKG